MIGKGVKQIHLSALNSWHNNKVESLRAVYIYKVRTFPFLLGFPFKFFFLSFFPSFF